MKAKTQNAPSTQEGLPDRPSRVLVAEDEHLVATDLTLMLTDLGYTVLLATDGDEALRIAESAAPDIALLDIRMPNRDGLAAGRELFERMRIPVVILSAYSDESEVAGAQGASVFGYLVKPVQRDQLRVALDIAWSRHKRLMGEMEEKGKLRKRLDDRRIIEQAKWAMVSTRGMTEPDAMRALQKRARDSRTQLVEVAAAVIREQAVA
jgi:two-component system, response regulator PdtaR